MPNDRRRTQSGGTFFLTLVTQNRAPIFAEEWARALLRESIASCQQRHAFTLDAIVLLPEHLHLLLTLASGQADYSAILKNIKSGFTRTYLAAGGMEQERSASRLRQGTRGVWLKRFRGGGSTRSATMWIGGIISIASATIPSSTGTWSVLTRGCIPRSTGWWRKDGLETRGAANAAARCSKNPRSSPRSLRRQGNEVFRPMFWLATRKWWVGTPTLGT